MLEPDKFYEFGGTLFPLERADAEELPVEIERLGSTQELVKI